MTELTTALHPNPIQTDVSASTTLWCACTTCELIPWLRNVDHVFRSITGGPMGSLLITAHGRHHYTSSFQHLTQLSIPTEPVLYQRISIADDDSNIIMCTQSDPQFGSLITGIPRFTDDLIDTEWSVFDMKYHEHTTKGSYVYRYTCMSPRPSSHWHR